jgi:hypothetical protein
VQRAAAEQNKVPAAYVIPMPALGLPKCSRPNPANEFQFEARLLQAAQRNGFLCIFNNVAPV